jgi:hypothetical protein
VGSPGLTDGFRESELSSVRSFVLVGLPELTPGTLFGWLSSDCGGSIIGGSSPPVLGGEDGRGMGVLWPAGNSPGSEKEGLPVRGRLGERSDAMDPSRDGLIGSSNSGDRLASSSCFLFVGPGIILSVKRR